GQSDSCAAAPVVKLAATKAAVGKRVSVNFMLDSQSVDGQRTLFEMYYLRCRAASDMGAPVY
ncbi:hypothetical protein, partial [Roseibium sp.]|uniref:hypothetical protein n=1 Tax=Roseibium sp. TaxID=1936156 RepID=UPI003297C9F8